ncbi:MAG: succinate dehydrogenase, hydrophobic membrane anchor protein [Cocleimonas sp.]|nr:succinate dehydrogenase, hydrophobic membrane anchor protein [Cocleimonas sp.]
MNNLRTPLSRAKGLGSAKAGTEHYMMQGVLALALVPLVIWLCLSLAFLPNANYTSIVSWLNSPLNAVLLVVTLMAGFYHGALGLQTIIEDYISNHEKRTFAIIIAKLLMFFFAVLGVFSVLKISISG